MPPLAAANTPPVANPDSFTTAEDQPLIIPLAALLANDTDADGDTSTVVSLFVGGLNGTITFGVNNDIYITPSTNFNGATSFTYYISDNHGGTASATVTIVVTSVIDPPINLPPTTATIAEDTLTPLTGLGVQAVDAGIEKLTLTVTVNLGKLFLTGGPANLTGSGTSTLTVYGTLPQINAALTNLVKFLPPTNYSGSVTLTMSTTDHGNLDGTVRTDTDLLPLTITAVNDDPIAANDYFTTGKNQLLIIPFAALLANDTDVEGDTLTVVSLFVGGLSGNISLGGNNDIHFLPSTNFTGATSFTYYISDNHGGAASATTTLLVANRPTLTTPGFDRGRYQFNLLGEIGTKYQIQTSSNLVHWTEWQSVTPLATNTPLTDATASSAPRRFYRAMLVP
ncbi:MAG: tandem-95 repeat protein [Verrucomicrobiota bacterium]